jgi:glycyl-tRNA synthetase (class II)
MSTSQIEKTIKEQNKKVKALISYSKKYFKIEKKEDLINATDLAVKIKIKLRELEEERKEYTDPLNKTVKKLNAAFKELTAPLTEIETQIKNEINIFREKEEQIRIKKEQELQKIENDKELTITPTIPDTIESNFGESRIVKRWSFDVIQKDKIPLEYLIPDEKKINKEISKGVRNIPGINIYQKITTSIYEKKK